MVKNGGILIFLFYQGFFMPKEPPETGTGHFHTIFCSKVTANLTFQGKTGKKREKWAKIGKNQQKFAKKMKSLKKMKNEKKRKKIFKFFTKLSKKWPKMTHNGQKWPKMAEF